MSTQLNRQFSKYMSKVIECLEQNIRKQIDNKKDYQVQNKWTNYEIFELKYGSTKPGKVSTCSFSFCLFVPI